MLPCSSTPKRLEFSSSSSECCLLLFSSEFFQAAMQGFRPFCAMQRKPHTRRERCSAKTRNARSSDSSQLCVVKIHHVSFCRCRRRPASRCVCQHRPPCLLPPIASESARPQRVPTKRLPGTHAHLPGNPLGSFGRLVPPPSARWRPIGEGST
jgi:hypothetical protein